MREGGPKDSADAGPKNEFVVKGYRKKGAKSEVLPTRNAMTQVTRGNLYDRKDGYYGKRPKRAGASPQY